MLFRSMTFKLHLGRYAWPTYRTLDMANPLGFTRPEAEPIFNSAEDFSDLLDGLESLYSAKAGALDSRTANCNEGDDQHEVSSTICR